MKRYSQLLMFTGGILTSFCFFLPWIKYDRSLIPRMVENPGPDVITMSGFETGGFLVILSFIAVLVILGVSIYRIKGKNLNNTRTLVLICNGIGLICVLLTLFLFIQARNSSMKKVADTLESIGFMNAFEDAIRLQFGGMGAVAGFIIVFIGAWNKPQLEVT